VSHYQKAGARPLLRFASEAVEQHENGGRKSLPTAYREKNKRGRKERKDRIEKKKKTVLKEVKARRRAKSPACARTFVGGKKKVLNAHLGTVDRAHETKEQNAVESAIQKPVKERTPEKKKKALFFKKGKECLLTSGGGLKKKRI